MGVVGTAGVSLQCLLVSSAVMWSTTLEPISILFSAVSVLPFISLVLAIPLSLFPL